MCDMEVVGVHMVVHMLHELAHELGGKGHILGQLWVSEQVFAHKQVLVLHIDGLDVCRVLLQRVHMVYKVA